MLGALAMAAACAGCGFGLTTGSAATPATAGAASGPVTLSAPAQAPPPSARASTGRGAQPGESCPRRVYDSMTEAQRVGQLFLVSMPSNAPTAAVAQAIGSYHFGSVLLSRTAAPLATLASDTAGTQALAGKNAGVRFFIAANQEGGQVQHLYGPGFAAMPPALSQGSVPAGTLRGEAVYWGRQLKAAGVNLDLAPVMDVVPAGSAATNAPIGKLQREFGPDPSVTGPHGAAFIQGMAAAGVATSAKHFPGLGLVRGNTDFAANVIDSSTTAGAPSVSSFQAAVKAGVPFVMIALATYTQIDAARMAVFSPAVIQGLLRGKLGFTGVVISDDIGQAVQVQGIPAGDRAESFLAAGGDMITSQSLGPAELMARAVLARASSDAPFRALVKAAALKVLAAKQGSGLLPCSH